MTLAAWYRAHRRRLPWRQRPTPYRIWVSEIMLQQTQVATVVPYYRRFMRAFPSPRALAQADLQKVLKLWEGLGYYSRARHLHRAAQELIRNHGGTFPRTAAALDELPGIGAYTAAAIASIAFGERVPVVDGNVLRVFSRYWGIADDVRSARATGLIRARLQAAMRGVDSASDFNQGLMELGALVCRPSHPACPHCPMATDCVARRDGLTAVLPRRRPRRVTPHYEIAVGVLFRHGRVLIVRRSLDQMLGGLWEFPGGKREPGELLTQTVEREYREETGLQVRATEPLCTVEHAYSHFRITLTAFVCELRNTRGSRACNRPAKWVFPPHLQRYPFPAANRKIIRRLRHEK